MAYLSLQSLKRKGLAEDALADLNELAALEDSDEGLGVDDGEAIARKADSTCRFHCDGLLSSS